MAMAQHSRRRREGAKHGSPASTAYWTSRGTWALCRHRHNAHLLRGSLEFVSWKDHKAVATALKDIDRAIDAAAGEAALTAFEDCPWDRKYPAIGQIWRR
jgi:transposase-like protein